MDHVKSDQRKSAGMKAGWKTCRSAFTRAFTDNGLAHWRIPLVLLAYTLGLVGSLWLSYQLRFDFDVPPHEYQQLWQVCLWIIPMKLALLVLIGQFAGLLSYFSIPDVRRVLGMLTSATAVITCVWVLSEGRFSPPRSVIIADLLLSFLALCAIRLFCRRLREVSLPGPAVSGQRVKRVAIIGAGDTGGALALELLAQPQLGLLPVVFADDNPQKWYSQLHGIRVIGAPEMLLEKIGRWRFEEVIIAMPSAPGRRIHEVVKLLQQAHLPFETVPSLRQLASGKVKVSQIRSVEIEDLLGREPVALTTESIRELLHGKVVLVTGAGGSIGSELCRQIAAYQPERLLLVEQSEGQMFQIEQELIGRGFGQVIEPLIGNILDGVRMREIFEQYQPQLVFHAAAHKHVPLMERHPAEAIKNNSLGTMRLALLSRACGVERFVFISTDKAINPTSVMGATKRLAEIFLQSFAAILENQELLPDTNGRHTKFMAVRFGNVLGSSGSVVPTFKAQIAAGGPVTVTHPDITRYFMTIPEAVGLVLQSATQGQGGEIFVLDMGKPIKIVDLARQLIELSGLRPGEDIEIKFVGVRPGEKLFEELSHVGENIQPTNHPKIMRFVSQPAPFVSVQRQLAQVEPRLAWADPVELKLLLQQLVKEYRPYLPEGARPAVNLLPFGPGNGNGNGNGHHGMGDLELELETSDHVE